MKSLFLFCLLILFGAAWSMRPKKLHCKGNTTAGYFTNCVPRCDTDGKPPKACSPSSFYGCVCKEGYLLVDLKSPVRCVKKLEDCPGYTGDCTGNTTAGYFTSCVPRCDTNGKPPEVCSYVISYGCTCKEGYLLVDARSPVRCVKKLEDCPGHTGVNCGKNAHFTNCGSHCPLTCDNFKNPPSVCTAECVIGCQCDKGFVRTSGGCCVKPENCPRNRTEPEKNCVDEKKTGPCKASVPSWYYNKETGQCQFFTYGGCQGNGNRYGSEEECKNNCVDE